METLTYYFVSSWCHLLPYAYVYVCGDWEDGMQGNGYDFTLLP